MSSFVDRREFLGMSGAGLLAGVASSMSLGQSVATAGNTSDTDSGDGKRLLAKRPNIVLFMPDEMRADAIACYGNPVTKTPNIDRLAKEGTLFANCHVQYPVCGASRCSMLTGWPTSVRGHRSLYYFLRPEEPNLFRYLRQSGYDVFWFGKNDALSAASFSDSVTQWAEIGYHGSTRDIPHELTPGIASMLFSPSRDRRETPDYQALQMAIKIIERKQSERPFCIFLPMLSPHPPYTVSEDFYSMYSPSGVPAPVPPHLKRKPAHHEGMRSMYGLDKLDEATFRKVRAVYYGQVSYSDWLLGELMAALDRTGRDSDTALFLLSDHGDYCGDYGLIEKWPSGLEDCLTHVPLIGRVPGGSQGGTAEEMVELYDIMQTCLELAGVKGNHTHFSRSLLPQLSGGKGDPDRSAFSEGGYNVYEPQCFEIAGEGGALYGPKHRLQNEEPITVARSTMVRTRTHKLIVRPHGQSELYDSKKDPGETENLFGERSEASVQEELQMKLLNHYINCTGIAPRDKDSRNCPPFYPTRSDLLRENWQRATLDDC